LCDESPQFLLKRQVSHKLLTTDFTEDGDNNRIIVAGILFLPSASVESVVISCCFSPRRGDFLTRIDELIALELILAMVQVAVAPAELEQFLM